MHLQKFKKLLISLGLFIVSFFIYYFYVNEKDGLKELEINSEQIDKNNLELKWKLLKNNLWINKNGELGIKISILLDKECSYYITELRHFESLSEVIDTNSFVKLSEVHYKDFRNVYFINYNSIYSSINTNQNVDINSFISLNSIYSKDKNNIYYGSEIMEDVDYETFSIIEDSPFGLAKDKYGLIAKGKRDKNEIKKILKLDEIFKTNK